MEDELAEAASALIESSPSERRQCERSALGVRARRSQKELGARKVCPLRAQSRARGSGLRKKILDYISGAGRLLARPRSLARASPRLGVRERAEVEVEVENCGFLAQL